MLGRAHIERGEADHHHPGEEQEIEAARVDIATQRQAQAKAAQGDEQPPEYRPDAEERPEDGEQLFDDDIHDESPIAASSMACFQRRAKSAIWRR